MPSPKEIVYPLVGLRLKEALKDKGMTQQMLVDKSGVSKASISQYAKGTHCPNNFTAIKLSKVLGVTPEWIMGLEGVKKENSKTDDIAMITLLMQSATDKQIQLIKRVLTLSDTTIDVLDNMINIAK